MLKKQMLQGISLRAGGKDLTELGRLSKLMWKFFCKKLKEHLGVQRHLL